MHFLSMFIKVCLASSFYLSTGKGEVITQNFGDCRNYFFGRMEPTGIIPKNAARICQTYDNKRHYATMYDRDLRIPVYSAYIFEPHGGGDRFDEWQIEPQLVDKKLSKNMEDEILTTIEREKVKKSQAVSDDYKSKDASDYDKGHLNPFSHHVADASKIATFSMTNIVPQLSTLNQGQWRHYEETMQRETADCHEAFVLTGVIPGKKYINNRVNIPSDVWSAVCCIQNNICQRSWAVIAENNADVVAPIDIDNLQNRIKTYTGRGVELFPAKSKRRFGHFSTVNYKSDNYYEMILGTLSELFHVLKEEGLRIFSNIFTIA
ncbi:endonuclease domain-containing 1 protein-like [Protopterus annectens]|uniref:endonuclease domain-containing 1 protein-like n=1 Tax=Protopterus annectens TaxID=7888 RepID=UPI001CFAD5A2|nr:endonuclease domain-containing 1 protein-like [Protopterus annectens]